MSLKNDIEMVKEELSSEEKFFERAVVTEKFVKKYKNVMIGTVVFVVVAVSGNIAYDLNKSSNIASANKALSVLEKDSSNAQALADLQSLSPALFDVWNYSQAIVNKDMEALKKLESSKTPIVDDLVAYELAVNSQDISKLDSYALKQNTIYGDLAKVQSAVILMNSGKTDLAHQQLSSINENSSLYRVAKSLLHYGVK